eukprot:TRINITY_DN15098_c0_g2_i1.p1 TRINITY_DN15098_c0_g2~~TRINITY_DN15098_c0_g2_i1.p1  ORF type:complete len:825 (-),score=179.18 TRINITY_DN15098_c0_g2_i1:39-2513(-)
MPTRARAYRRLLQQCGPPSKFFEGLGSLSIEPEMRTCDGGGARAPAEPVALDDDSKLEDESCWFRTVVERAMELNIAGKFVGEALTLQMPAGCLCDECKKNGVRVYQNVVFHRVLAALMAPSVSPGPRTFVRFIHGDESDSKPVDMELVTIVDALNHPDWRVDWYAYMTPAQAAFVQDYIERVPNAGNLFLTRAEQKKTRLEERKTQKRKDAYQSAREHLSSLLDDAPEVNALSTDARRESLRKMDDGICQIAALIKSSNVCSDLDDAILEKAKSRLAELEQAEAAARQAELEERRAQQEEEERKQKAVAAQQELEFKAQRAEEKRHRQEMKEQTEKEAQLKREQEQEKRKEENRKKHEEEKQRRDMEKEQRRIRLEDEKRSKAELRRKMQQEEKKRHERMERDLEKRAQQDRLLRQLELSQTQEEIASITSKKSSQETQCKRVVHATPALRQDTTTSSIAEAQEKSFTFTVLKYEGVPLGLSFAATDDRQGLLVDAVQPDSAIAAWNRSCVTAKNEQKIVRFGDRIISVNGVSCQRELMIQECDRNGPLKIDVFRDKTLPLRALTPALAEKATGEWLADQAVMAPRTACHNLSADADVFALGNANKTQPGREVAACETLADPFETESQDRAEGVIGQSRVLECDPTEHAVAQCKVRQDQQERQAPRSDGKVPPEAHQVRENYHNPTDGYLQLNRGDWILVMFWQGDDEMDSSGWCYASILGDDAQHGWLPQRILEQAPPRKTWGCQQEQRAPRSDGVATPEAHQAIEDYDDTCEGYLQLTRGDWLLVLFWQGADEFDQSGWCHGHILGEVSRSGWFPQRVLDL